MAGTTTSNFANAMKEFYGSPRKPKSFGKKVIAQMNTGPKFRFPHAPGRRGSATIRSLLRRRRSLHVPRAY